MNTNKTATTESTGTTKKHGGRRVRARPDDKPQVVQLARLLAKAVPLAELIDSDEFTDTDRARLRELVGVFSYFHLTTSLCQMCSQRARSVR